MPSTRRSISKLSRTGPIHIGPVLFQGDPDQVSEDEAGLYNMSIASLSELRGLDFPAWGDAYFRQQQ